MASRTPNIGTKTVRCKAVEGAQQCLSATHGKLQNHRWGPKGETPQWREDGTQKAAGAVTEEFTPDPALAAEARRLVAEEQTRLVTDPHGPSDALAAKAFPEGSLDGCPHLDHDLRCVLPVNHDGVHDMRPRSDPSIGEQLLGPGAVEVPARSHEEIRADAASHRRTEIAAAVTDDDVRDMEAIRASHPDIITPNGPRPVSVSGTPGSRLADSTNLVSTWTLMGFPVEVQDELTQVQIVKHIADSMLEEVIRTKRPSDPALVAALVDASDHIARARGLVRGTGAGT